MREFATNLNGRHGERVEWVPIDLTEDGTPGRLQAEADRLGFEPDLIVNNAGTGMDGPMTGLSLDRQPAIVRLNVESVVALTGLYLPWMTARHNGTILNIASSVAFYPVPYVAVYAASKALGLSFSEALWA